MTCCRPCAVNELAAGIVCNPMILQRRVDAGVGEQYRQQVHQKPVELRVALPRRVLCSPRVWVSAMLMVTMYC